MPSTGRDPRTQSLWDLHDFGRGRGLEVGALFRPLVRRHEADVRYVDIADRSTLVELYSDHPGMPVDDFVEVDYPLTVDGVTRSMADATSPEAPFDWVVASHVIEHVPDIIGWLKDVADLTVDGGSLVLVVPDKRYSFDLHRPTTSVGSMLQAHLDHDVRPSVRAVYDHYREAIEAHSDDLWAGELPGFEARIHDDEFVAARVDEAATTYTDCHVWVFTPEVFLSQVQELRRAGLCEWYVDRFEPTGFNQLEFLVRLRRTRREDDAATLRPSDEISPSIVRPEWMDWQEQAAVAAEEAARLRDIVHRQRRRVRRLRARLDQAEAALGPADAGRRGRAGRLWAFLARARGRAR